ncbi:hypothetical protein AN958_03666, partial [Leucoagaricus sp. SymC.cos]
LVLLVSGGLSIYTNNLNMVRQVISGSHMTSFYKLEHASQALLLWGMNLVGADGDTWRKHRCIMGPVFSNSLYEYVWNESIQTFKEMVSSDRWLNKKSVEVPAIQYTLFIIGKCAFSLPFTWSKLSTALDGTMSLQEVLHLSNDMFLMRVLTPKWTFKLPITSLRRAKQANNQLLGFMQQQIEERRQEVRNGMIKRDDVFMRLVQVNEDEESKYRLVDDKLMGSFNLIGNIFVMLFTGHEDTILTIPNKDGIESTRMIPVSKDRENCLLEYNPHYFDELGKFKPLRWYGVPANSEMFTAFSIRPRVCLGRKFSMTESIVFLTLLLRDWRVEPLLSAGETREQWGERVLNTEFKITFSMASMPIQLMRQD